MAVSSLVKYRFAILTLLLLVPSIWFGAVYAANSISSARGTDRYSLTSDEGWSVDFTASHLSYFIAGQQIPLNLSLKLIVSNPNVTIGVDDVRAEVRDPSRVNSTTGAVEGWRTLSYVQTAVGTNYTATGKLSKVIGVVAVYPPSSSFFDPFVPSMKIALNGVVDFTVYQSDGNMTTASPQSISLLDSQGFYQTQLSTVMSPSSWMVYQLSTAVLVLVAYIRIRPAEMNPAETTYAVQVQSYRIQRKLANLEELMKSHKISESRYRELKQEYEKELAQSTT